MQSNAENFYLKTLTFNGTINYRFVAFYSLEYICANFIFRNRIFSAFVGCGSYMDPPTV